MCTPAEGTLLAYKWLKGNFNGDFVTPMNVDAKGGRRLINEERDR